MANSAREIPDELHLGKFETGILALLAAGAIGVHVLKLVNHYLRYGAKS